MQQVLFSRVYESQMESINSTRPLEANEAWSAGSPNGSFESGDKGERTRKIEDFSRFERNLHESEELRRRLTTGKKEEVPATSDHPGQVVAEGREGVASPSEGMGEPHSIHGRSMR